MASQHRKTSIGISAAGRTGLPPQNFQGALRKRDRAAHVYGLFVAVFIHLGVVGAVFAMNEIERQRVENKKDEPFTAIEAGLAIKKKSQSGAKTKLPTKDVVAPVKPPDAPKIAKNPDIVPPKPDEKKKPEKKDEYVPPDATKAKSIFDKYRHATTGEMQGGSKDDQNQAGSDSGSDYGTLEQAKGDPYIGELIGRMVTDFVIPTVIADQSLVAFGCVKLDANGHITARELAPDHRTRSHAFNSAVEERLRITTDMDKPVPSHLKAMLVGKFVCATYTSRTQ